MEADDTARFSAELPSLGAAGPPGQPPIVATRDVILIAGDPAAEQGDADELVLLPRFDRTTMTRTNPPLSN